MSIAGLYFPDGGDDIVIGTAPADIAAHELMYVGGSMGMSFVEEANRGTDLTGGAVAALIGVVFDKRLLHGMQVVAIGESFDAGDLRAVAKTGEGQTGIHPFTIDEDCTGAALAAVAAFFGAGHG